MKCAISLAKKQEEKKREKAQKEELKAWNKYYREEKEKDKKKPAFENDLQDEVNTILIWVIKIIW